MIDNFQNGKVEYYSNHDLTTAVMCHRDTIRFFNEVRKEFLAKLKKYGGNITEIANEQLDQENIKQPTFNTWTDKFHGLTIAINNTWAYDVQITEYQLKDDGTYKGKMKIIIYDHFGLDNNDVKPERPASKFDGFYNWFALQRWEGFNKKYKPFITVIEKEFPFKGRL